MAEIKRRDEAPKPTKEPKTEESSSGGVSRREFLVGSGAGVAGLVIGGVVGNQVLGKPAAPVAEAPVAEAPAEGEVSAYKAGYNLVFDPVQCTGCMVCAFACAEKYATYLHPEETANVVNLEFSRIRPMRFQYVDVINFCSYCNLFEWAEGSSEYPCAAVCPEDALVTVPEGEGAEGYYGMGYKWVDREKCLGIDACWRCAEICEDQFGSGMSFDPIDRKAQVCSRCGGDPECVKACPEDGALVWVPAARNGRYYANTPSDYAELLYRKIYAHVREL
ncbi:MAG TPA: twin-arginine translocation signal domain-containing protein [Anaerolineaceae bacterium]|nr:twin-arginine translocation signal domain-containing protein [Anaerolineaceae bacterium]